MAMHPGQLPWSARYPELADLLAHHPELPQRNTFERNVIVMKTGEAVALKMGLAGRNTSDLITQRDNWITTGDPGFVDAAAGNLTLRPGSEAFQKIPGFQSIPVDQIGLQVDEYRSSLPPEATQARSHAGQSDANGNRNFGT